MAGTQEIGNAALTELALSAARGTKASMEFALSEALPLYSGPGNVAGSSLKTARNLGLPAIDVTIVYQQSH